MGTRALHAFEATCGVRVPYDAIVIQDIDLLLDSRKNLGFVITMARLDTSLLFVLKKD